VATGADGGRLVDKAHRHLVWKPLRLFLLPTVEALSIRLFCLPNAIVGAGRFRRQRNSSGLNGMMNDVVGVKPYTLFLQFLSEFA
jgi:hypothetical protein